MAHRNKALRLWKLLRLRRWRILLRELWRGCWSNQAALGLSRDLTVDFPAPRSRIQIEIRPLQPADAAILFDPAGGMPDAGVEHRMRRRSLLDSGIPACYVAVDRYGYPCHVLWLMRSQDNGRINDFFSGIFPPLEPNTVLIEGSFTLETFRGLGVDAQATWQITEMARQAEARRAICFVAEENVASIKAKRRAGFEPYCRRQSRWRFFRRSTTFTDLPPGTQYSFETVAP